MKTRACLTLPNWINQPIFPLCIACQGRGSTCIPTWPCFRTFLSQSSTHSVYHFFILLFIIHKNNFLNIKWLSVFIPLYELTLLMVFICKDDDEWNTTIFLMKISLTTLSITVYDFWRGIPCRLPPFCVGTPSCPGCHLGTVFGTVVNVNTSCSVKWGYKATLQLMARVPLPLGESTPRHSKGHWFVG